MPLKARENVGRDADGPETGCCLGRPQLQSATHVIGGPLHPDGGMQNVDVPPLEPKDLTRAEMTPRRQLDGYPPWLGMASARASTSAMLNMGRSGERSCPAPLTMHGFRPISSSVTAVPRIPRRRR